MPAPSKPSEQAEIGVLLVHGIGDHKEGETLVGFGEPVIDWLRDWLRTSGDGKARGSVRVSEARLRATRTEAVSPAYAQVDIELFATPAEAARSERWLVAEAWWGDSVQPPRTLRLLTWLLTRGPLLIYWHFYLGPLRVAREWSQRQLLFAGVAFVLAALLQAVVLVAMTLWLIPFGPWRRAVANGVRALTLTLGDSFVLLEQDFQSAALVRRVDRALDWLGQRAAKLIVVAHSQGGAIAHEALRRLRTDQVAAFISVGSGLEKLHFLRHVRDKRGGLVAASLLVPLVLAGAPLLFAGAASAASERWMAGVGGLVMIAAVVSLAVLINALDSYRRELGEPMGELDLRPSLGAAQWHDLHASHDVVPMGEGSLMGKLGFLTRGELANQRSYLNDHVSYFENRLGFLPLLWQLLACHSGLPLFRDADTQALATAVRRHGRHAWVLWFAGLANWAALALGLYALRDSLAGFGSSVLVALDGVGLAALAKPVRLTGSALAWLGQRTGAVGAEFDAARVTPPLLAALTLVGVVIAWFVLFRAAWLLRAAADWRKVCRTQRLTGRGRRIWEAATLALWAGFALTPLLAAAVFAAGPSAQTWQLLTQAVAGVLSLMCVALAGLYAMGSPWASDAAAERLWLPAGALLVVAGFLWTANWFWPEAWGALPMRTMLGLVWLGMALSWLAWLLLRGVGVYGRLVVAVLVLLALLLGAAIVRSRWLPADIPIGWLQALDIGIVAMVSLVEAVRSRALVLQLVRGLPPLRWVWPLRPTP